MVVVRHTRISWTKNQELVHTLAYIFSTQPPLGYPDSGIQWRLCHAMII